MTGNYSTKVYSFECDHVKRTVAELVAVVPVSIILFLFLATQFL
jgi:hypothetical protein